MTENRVTLGCAAGIAMLMLMLVFGGLSGTAQAVDCVGKPYGYPGCPTSGSGSTKCGDSVVQTQMGEECDDGRFNGQTTCSKNCKLLVCGDGTVSPSIGEECEPVSQLVYVQGADGTLTTQRLFAQPNQCAGKRYCSVPQCDANGKCTGGCKWVFGNSCTVNSAAASSQGTVSTSAAHSLVSSSSLSSQSSRAVNTSSAQLSSAQGSNTSISSSAIASSEAAFSSVAQSSPAPSSVSSVAGICGDGRKDPGEECDNGPKNSDSTPGACRLNCKRAHCGDGVMDPGEECDNGRTNSDTMPGVCRANCKLARCGDGVVDPGEQCDGGDTCTQTCQLIASPAALPQSGSGAAAAGHASSISNSSMVLSVSPEQVGPLAGALSMMAGVMIAVLGYVFRTKLISLFARKKTITSIEDVALNEIEMPWHKW